MILLTSSTIALLPVYVVPFDPFNKQQPYGCVCVRECISLCLANGSVCEKDTSPIAYVIRSLCLAHCAHDIYHCTVSAGKIIDRPLCVCIYASTMEPIQFWLPVGFFYVLLLFALCPRFFHLHVFIEIHMSLRILIESSEIFLPQELRTTPFERCVESSLTYQFVWKKMIENELSINAENSHRPILE